MASFAQSFFPLELSLPQHQDFQRVSKSLLVERSNLDMTTNRHTEPLNENLALSSLRRNAVSGLVKIEAIQVETIVTTPVIMMRGWANRQ